MHFCRLRKVYPGPQLSLNGNPIPVLEEVNFLGVILDKNSHFSLICDT